MFKNHFLSSNRNTDIQKRKYSEFYMIVDSLTFLSMSAVNIINIPPPKRQVTPSNLYTAKMVALCMIKAGVYSFFTPFSLIGVAISYANNDVEKHFVPTSVYFKNLRGEEEPKETHHQQAESSSTKQEHEERPK